MSSNTNDNTSIGTLSSGLGGGLLVGGGFLVLILVAGQVLISLSTLHRKFRGGGVWGTRNVILMKVCDMTVAIVSWIIVGWSFANGSDPFWVMFIGKPSSQSSLQSENQALWFYQFTLLLVSVNVMSSAAAYRVRGPILYFFICLTYCVVVFPLICFWCNSVHGWASPYRSDKSSDLLSGCGVLDTAGSGFVYLSGGVAALVLLLMFQSKLPAVSSNNNNNSNQASRHEDVYFIKKFREEFEFDTDDEEYYDEEDDNNAGRPRTEKSLAKKAYIALNRSNFNHFSIMQLVGIFLSVAGSIGFNCVNNLPADSNATVVAGKRAVSTIIAAVSASCVGSTFSIIKTYCCKKKHRPLRNNDLKNMEHTIITVVNSTLSGLVAISGPVSTCEFEGAFVVGFVAGALYLGVVEYLRYIRFTDDTDVIAVHVVNGAWGLIATGLLASPGGYEYSMPGIFADGTSRATYCAGGFYGGSGAQLAANICFSLSIWAWAFVIMVVATYPVRSLLRYLRPAQHIEGEALSALELINLINKQERAKRIKEQENLLAREKPLITFSKDSLGLLSAQEDHSQFKVKYGYSWDIVFVLPWLAPKETTWDPTETEKDVAEKHKKKQELMERESIKIIKEIQSVGLETYCYLSYQKDELIVKVRAPLKRIKMQADTDSYKLMLDEEKAEEMAKAGFEGIGADGKVVKIKPFDIDSGFDEKITSLRPFQNIYGRYTRDRSLKDLYKKAKGLNHPFSANHRLKIIDRIIQGDGDGCLHYDIDKYIADGRILAYFAMHDEAMVQEFDKRWLRCLVPSWEQPNGMIKDYFGEHIALYFAFMAHNITLLLPLSLIGLAVTVHLIAASASSHWSLYTAIKIMYSVPIYSFFICLWTEYLLGYWKSIESKSAQKWGMVGYELEEADRHEFIGVSKKSYINGEPMKVFPLHERMSRRRLSNYVISVFVMFIFGMLGGIFYFKFWLHYSDQNPEIVTLGMTLADIVNGIQIAIMAAVYNYMAEFLTNNENCRTDTEYDDSLISKLFAFNFINSYTPSLYIAFVKKAVNDTCTADSCMGELGKTLFIIFVTRLIVGNISVIFAPLVNNFLRKRKEMSLSREDEKVEKKRKSLSALKKNNNNAHNDSNNDSNDSNHHHHAENGHNTPTHETTSDHHSLYRSQSGVVHFDFSFAESQYVMERYTSTVQDYNDLSVQFGYMTLFVAAIPFAPILAMISSMIKLRADGWKLLIFCRRSIPKSAEDIGTWYDIFSTISAISVFTNAGLIFWTMDIFDSRTPLERLWFAGLFICGTFFLRYEITATFFLKQDQDVEIQTQRQEFIVGKLIDKLPDKAIDADDGDDPVMQVVMEGEKDGIPQHPQGGGEHELIILPRDSDSY